ncbi:F-box protein At5g07610-like [Benincasa hispida]|uniref:F-box protein At5g07610-like n=1 Tax=Benincasa hispida TaxID=102211 RepID=UPI0019019356|nr:F-box protein At5g07610-like [Benincasa hispida]
MLCSKSHKLHRTSAASLPPLTTAAEPVLNNDDLFIEILLRLPIQSLLTFKSVSKRWLSLISNPDFSHRRTTSHPSTPSGIFFPRPRPKSPAFDFLNLTANPSRAPFESLNFTDEKHGFVILQSCNGLFLCSSNNGNYWRRDYYVHNPTTNHFTKLPKLQAGTVFGLTLAFDPSRSSDYKVISVRYSDSFTNTYQIEIYSSRTGPWRPVQGVFSAPFSMRFDNGVYWNRAVHWISTWENSLYFDLYEEKLHELPMPRVPDGREERRVKYFGTCGGNLHLIEIYDARDMELNVYEMQDDHSGWFVKYRVDLHGVSVAFPEMIPSVMDVDLGFFPKFSVMAIVDGIEESYIVLKIDGIIVRVIVESGRFESLGKIESGGGTSQATLTLGFGEIDAYLYIESLACV